MSNITNSYQENFLKKIYLSFFSQNFYQKIFNEQKSSGFSFIVKLLIIAYTTPAIFFSYKLINFDINKKNKNTEIFINEIQNLPKFRIANKELQKNNNFPIIIPSQLSKNYNLFYISDQENIKNNKNIISITKHSIHLNTDRYLLFLLELTEIVNVKKIIFEMDAKEIEPSDKLIIPYQDLDIEVTPTFVINKFQNHIKNMGYKVIVPILPIILMLIILWTYIEVFIWCFMTRIFLNNINFTQQELRKIIISALIPASSIKMINGIFLFSSYLLAGKIGLVLILIIKIYYIKFAISSVILQSRTR